MGGPVICGVHNSCLACVALAIVPALVEVIVQTPTLAPAPSALAISAKARSIQPGEVVRLDVTCTCKPSQAPGTATFSGRDVLLAPTIGGWSGIIGLDVALAPGSYPVRVVVEPLNEPPVTGSYTLTVSAKQFRTRQLRVAPNYVNPPPETVERILVEGARLDALFAQATWRERVGPFQPPLEGVTARDTFGARSVFNGQPRSPHGGVDYGCPLGTPIVAPAPGVVALAEDLYFTGSTVVLDHGRGLYSVLAHLSSIAVAGGAWVEGGAVVGAAGATGRVTGPHLHWGTRLNGARVDPLSLLAVLTPP